MAITAETLRETIRVADGAWGTELDKRGVPAGYCREEWNVSHPDKVHTVAAAYVDAGSDIILTNTFTGNAFVLGRHGFADRTAEFSKAGAAISKKAADGKALVFGSVGPTGKMLMMEEASEQDVYDAFKTQVVALAEGGADGIVCETFTELAEALLALKAVKDNTNLPAVVSLTYDSGPDQTATVMGVTPQQAAEQLAAAGATAIGCNCGVGIDNYIKVARLLRDCTDLPIWVKPNAGLPEVVDGKVTYKQKPDAFAAKVPELIDAGANIIGGCCGTSPEFIRAIRKVVDKR
jgi:5-methyltetrahydrofolate--homocysteine methyltransferase